MKNLKLILVVFLTLLGMQANAEELVLSAPNNLKPGDEFLLSIGLINERTDYCAFKMDIVLEDGVTFVQEMNDDEELDYVVALNADRKKSDHSVSSNLVSNDILRVICYSNTNKTFKENSGEIVTVKLKVEDWVGKAITVCVKDAYFSTTAEEDFYLDDTCTTFSVANPAYMEQLKAYLNGVIAEQDSVLQALTYPNVQGASELSDALSEAKQYVLGDVTEDSVYVLINNLTTYGSTAAWLSNMYADLAARATNLENMIALNESADAEMKATATSFIAEVRQGLQNYSYTSENIQMAMRQLMTYAEDLGKLNLIFNVEEAGTLESLVNDITQDYSVIVGLTVTGKLNDADLSVIAQMSQLKTLNMKEADVTVISDQLFDNKLRQLQTLVLPKGLVTIGSDAFRYCTSLAEIVFPASLRTIGSYAFRYAGLTKLELPEGVTTLNWDAFANCYSLKEVVLPSTVVMVDGAFYNSRALKSITCKALLPPTSSGNIIGNNYERNCVLIVPSMSIEDYRNAAYWEYFDSIQGGDFLSNNMTIYSDCHLNSNDEAFLTIQPTINVAKMDRGNNYWNPYDRYRFGALYVEGDAVLSAKNFRMAYDPYAENRFKDYGYSGVRASAVLINNAPVRANQVQIDLCFMANRWYFLSMPFDVKVSDIAWKYADQPFVIYKYDGKKRADQDMQNTWVRMTADSVLHAGQGYIWQAAEYIDQNGYYYDEIGCVLTAVDNGNKNSIFINGDANVKMAEYLSEFVQDRSWNLLGNPYPCYFDSRAMDITAPFTIWNGGNYEAYSPVDDNYIFAPGEAFFFQRPVDQAEITFMKDGRQADRYETGRVYFNGARQSEMTAQRSVFNLTIEGPEQNDRTRFVINEEASLAYEMDKDASKFTSMNTDAIQLYTMENGVRYAINERPLGKGEISLGISIAKKGSYTLKLDAKNEVVIVDRQLGTEVLLDENGYTFDAEAGKLENRFVLRVVDGDATGIKTIATKHLNNENIFNLNGIRVKEPQKGLYILDGKKVVVR